MSWVPFCLPKKSLVAALVIVTCAGLALTSCFSEKQTATGPLPLTGECRIPISAAAAGTVIVFIRNFTFIPEQVTVKRGTRVTWVNCEDAGSDSHTATSDAGVWDSPTLQVGAAFTRTFDDPTGTALNYHCVPHPFMKGTVSVE